MIPYALMRSSSKPPEKASGSSRSSRFDGEGTGDSARDADTRGDCLERVRGALNHHAVVMTGELRRVKRRTAA